MLREVEWAEDRFYRSGGENEPLQFYLDALTNSTKLDLLLGYFSSAAISVLSVGFAKFLSSGGTIRMIINNILSDQDKKAIKRGLENKDLNIIYDLTDIKGLKNILDEYGMHFFECLAWLIAEEKITIKIIKPKGKGIAHYKEGIFHDELNKVGFTASCNFTAFGLLENLERVTTFLSWENQGVVGLTSNFEEIFSGNADFVEYLTIDDIQVAIKNEFGNKDINELIIQEKELLEKIRNFNTNKLKDIIWKVEEQENEFVREPRFPYAQGPRAYQSEAYNKWIENGYKGIFAMATGTGKTITSLNCVLNEYSKIKSYKVIILVPTTVLVNQWEKEAISFNFGNIIKVSSKNSGWKKELDNISFKELYKMPVSYVIISTYKSFCSNKFQEFISKAQDDVILIADEAHNLGAKNVKEKIETLNILKRIGLSATPKRIYDPEGSDSMEKFFDDTEPYTYTFSMERAISDGILSEYYYFPSIVELNEEESIEYGEISIQLAKSFQMSKKNDASKKQYEMQLMKRKSLLHKAKNKLRGFESIVKEIIGTETGLKYLLVYAPEGYYGDDDGIEEDYPDVESDSRIIDYYSNIIRNVSPKTTVTQYTSNTEDKEHILKSFENGKIDVLLSMKCLDEGVDIPRTEQAIFCSSTGNPRQFIQRRGRILRKHDNKRFAKIFDLVVIPKIALHGVGYEIERKLVKKELERVVHFAYMAINKYEAIEPLREICNYYQLNLDTIHTELIVN